MEVLHSRLTSISTSKKFPIKTSLRGTTSNTEINLLLLAEHHGMEAPSLADETEFYDNHPINDEDEQFPDELFRVSIIRIKIKIFLPGWLIYGFTHLS